MILSFFDVFQLNVWW